MINNSRYLIYNIVAAINNVLNARNMLGELVSSSLTTKITSEEMIF